MNICLLISGIVKKYEYLDFLFKLCENNYINHFFIFGHCFSFLGVPHQSKDKINYNNDNSINKDFLKEKFHHITFVENYDEFDNDGFDNRIFSQWNNVYIALQNAMNYSSKHNIQYDIIIKARTDIYIQPSLFYHYIQKSFKTKKIIFGNKSCHIIQDQLFIGPTNKMIKILNLSQFYYKYSNTQPYLKWAMKRKNLLINNERHLRFPGMSEIFLYHHLTQNLKLKDYIIVDKYWKIR